MSKISVELQEQLDEAAARDVEAPLYSVNIDLVEGAEPPEVEGRILSSRVGGGVRGKLTADEIKRLQDHDDIREIWTSAPKSLDLKHSVEDIKGQVAWALRTTPTPEIGKGQGVIVGVIDSGINVTHPCFLKPDGTTRIIHLWDQTFDYVGGAADVNDLKPKGWTAADPLPPPPTLEDGTTPITLARNRTPARRSTTAGDVLSGLTTGAEFDASEINSALTSSRASSSFKMPISLSDGLDAKSAHGTHVAGIAAGNGNVVGACNNSGTFVGVAPEADIIFVKTGVSGNGIHDFDKAIDYIFTKADLQSGGAKPVAVNYSMGSVYGQHNGLDPESRSLDGKLRNATGKAFIRTAGNGRDDKVHAAFAIAENTTQTIKFDMLHAAKTWFWITCDAFSDFEIQLKFPGRLGRNVVIPPFPMTADTSRAALNGNIFKLYERSRFTGDVNYPSDPDRHFTLVFTTPPPTPPNTTHDYSPIRTGEWELNFVNKVQGEARVHIWASSHEENVFLKPNNMSGSSQYGLSDFPEDFLKSTLNSDACTWEPIAVGSYDHKKSGRRKIPDSTGQGPVPFDLFTGLFPSGPPLISPSPPVKPDISAPGVGIWSAKATGQYDNLPCCDCCLDNFVSKGGTSMAAPHVTGVVALMLSANPQLTHREIKAILTDPANVRAAPSLPTGMPPAQELFGAGMIDAEKCVQGAIASVRQAVDVPLPQSAPNEGLSPQAAEARSRANRPPSIADILAEWEGVLGRQPAWNFIVGLVSRHFSEVQRLINSEKKVGAVWQRNGGPDVVRSFVFASELPDPPLPAQVKDRDTSKLIAQLIRILRRFGGDKLQRDIERYETIALQLPGMAINDVNKVLQK